MSEPVNVKVWGELACFTRPEFKVERVTYPVMTATAAKGILEAIFWKPEFDWIVRTIRVLRPVYYMSVTRNEVNRVSSASSTGIIIEEARTQRHSLLLRDVAYVITADIALRRHATDDVAKYRDQFRRRVERGACAHRPALGIREYVAFFAPPDPSDVPLDIDITDIGLMPVAMRYGPGNDGAAEPVLLDVQVRRGVLTVPQVPR